MKIDIRFWDNSSADIGGQKMYSIVEFYENGFDAFDAIIGMDDDIIPMLCSELKDKNDMKLFDGDLINLGGLIYELFFNDGAWQIKGNPNQGRNCMLQVRADKCELVGNKFQNPELAKS